MINKAGRYIADFYQGYGNAVPFQGAFDYFPEGLKRAAAPVKRSIPGKDNKVAKSLKDVFQSIPIRDGMTLSFHSAYRNGDYLVNMVFDIAAELGIKDLTVSASGLFPVHKELVKHIHQGVISHIDVNGVMGELAECVMRGELPTVTTIRSHGGRPRSIECGQQHIDVAFIAASAADKYGNLNGIEGTSVFGSLGYSMADAEYADYVVGVTDHLSDFPLNLISIPQTRVDYVVEVDKIGDTAGIATGTLKPSRDPLQLAISQKAVDITDKLGLVKDGYSFQCGAGGVAIAFAQGMSELLKEKQVQAGFCVGGISGYMVEMLEQGLVRTLYDTQCFDLQAIRSINRNPGHVEIGASFYANPFNAGCIVNRLDSTMLGALEIDTNFNVNVLTGNNGNIFAGVGGNPDTAAGAGVTIVAANLLRGRIPVVVDSVHTICTPGETVDILITERGVAVNPLRPDLIERLKDQKVALTTIDELKYTAEKITGKPRKVPTTDEVVAVVEYRDGTILDTVRKVDYKAAGI